MRVQQAGLIFRDGDVEEDSAPGQGDESDSRSRGQDSPDIVLSNQKKVVVGGDQHNSGQHSLGTQDEISAAP